MKSKLISCAKVCATVVALLVATSSHANFVINGGFEVNPPTGWNNFPGAKIDVIAAGYSGQGAGFTPGEDFSESISQSIALKPGATYIIQFFQKSTDATINFSFDSKPFSSFEANGTPDDYRFGEPADNGWLEFSALITGSLGGVMQFTFTGADGSSAFLDEVSIVCSNDPTLTNNDCRAPNGGGNNDVPEPGSLLLVGAALAGLGLVRRRKSA